MFLISILKYTFIVFFISCSLKAVSPSNKKNDVRSSQTKRKTSQSQVKKVKTFLDLDIVKKINKRQARRSNALETLKLKGTIGESENGLIKIRQTTGLSKKDQDTMKKLVQVENNDRTLVYKKIQELEKYKPLQMKFLRKKMFENYLELDLPGSYYYEGSAWKKKK